MASGPIAPRPALRGRGFRPVCQTGTGGGGQLRANTGSSPLSRSQSPSWGPVRNLATREAPHTPTPELRLLSPLPW